MRMIYRWLRTIGDARAASRGPQALVKRRVRRSAHRTLAKGLRKL